MKRIILILLISVLLIGCGKTTEEPAKTKSYSVYDVSFELPAEWELFEGSTESVLAFYPNPENTDTYVTVGNAFKDGYGSDHTEEEVIRELITVFFREYGIGEPDIKYETLSDGKIFGWASVTDSDDSVNRVLNYMVYANDDRCIYYSLMARESEEDIITGYLEAIHKSMESIETENGKE